MRRRRETIYAITRCADGRWLALNRDYKPFGQRFTRCDWLNYDECPGIRLSLTARQIQRMAGGCQPFKAGNMMAWLYADATNPEKSAAHAVAYRARLAKLFW